MVQLIQGQLPSLCNACHIVVAFGVVLRVQVTLLEAQVSGLSLQLNKFFFVVVASQNHLIVNENLGM